MVSRDIVQQYLAIDNSVRADDCYISNVLIRFHIVLKGSFKPLLPSPRGLVKA